ncbi:MAG: flagellar motor switch protein FliN [Hyphomicrobiales bacterium]|nr:MAG: flagellar motor switch protein FliN [Hyphomicrobiales bacterium]
MSDQEDLSKGKQNVDLLDLNNEGAEASGHAPDNTPRTAADLQAVFDVPVKVSAVLGRSQMEVSELLRLDQGTIVELDRKVGEPIDIFINDRLVARGEVVLMENRLGVTMTEIIKAD